MHKGQHARLKLNYPIKHALPKKHMLNQNKTFHKPVQILPVIFTKRRYPNTIRTICIVDTDCVLTWYWCNNTPGAPFQASMKQV